MVMDSPMFTRSDSIIENCSRFIESAPKKISDYITSVRDDLIPTNKFKHLINLKRGSLVLVSVLHLYFVLCTIYYVAVINTISSRYIMTFVEYILISLRLGTEQTILIICLYLMATVLTTCTLVPIVEESYKKVCTNVFNIISITKKDYYKSVLQNYSGIMFGLMEWLLMVALSLVIHIILIGVQISRYFSGSSNKPTIIFDWLLTSQGCRIISTSYPLLVTSFYCVHSFWFILLLFGKLIGHAALAFNEPTKKTPLRRSILEHQWWNLRAVALGGVKATVECCIRYCIKPITSTGFFAVLDNYFINSSVGGGLDQLITGQIFIPVIMLTIMTAVVYWMFQLQMKAATHRGDRFHLLLNLDHIIESRLDLERQSE